MMKLDWSEVLMGDGSGRIDHVVAHTNEEYVLRVMRETAISHKFELYVMTDESERILVIARGAFLKEDNAMIAAEKAFFTFNPYDMYQNLDALGLPAAEKTA